MNMREWERDGGREGEIGRMRELERESGRGKERGREGGRERGLDKQS